LIARALLLLLFAALKKMLDSPPPHLGGAGQGDVSVAGRIPAALTSNILACKGAAAAAAAAAADKRKHSESH
jgi:hypothetical protein